MCWPHVGHQSCLWQGLLGMFLCTAQEASTKCVISLLEGENIITILKALGVFLSPCWGQVCLGYFPTALLPVECTLSILEGRTLSLFGTISLLKLHLLPSSKADVPSGPGSKANLRTESLE